MAKRAVKKKFPARILVTRETDQNDPNDSWLNVSEDAACQSIEDGAEVAIYEYVGTRTMRIQRSLQEPE